MPIPENQNPYGNGGGGPGGPGGGGTGGAFNYGAFSIDPSVQAALDAILRGNNRFKNVLGKFWDQGLVTGPADITGDWISEMLGQNLPGKTGQFLSRVQRYMQTGELPRDYVGNGGGGGGDQIPESLQGAGAQGGGWHRGNNDPFGGRLGGYIQDLIEDLRGRHGLPEDVLANLYNQADATSKGRERDRLLRRGGDFAASGLFGSGVQNRALQDIEAQESDALLGAKNDIGYANAQAAVQQVNQLLQALGMASGRELGLGQLNLGYGNLGLGYDQLALSRELGLGNLELGRGDLALQAAIQEWLINSGLWGRF